MTILSSFPLCLALLATRISAHDTTGRPVVPRPNTNPRHAVERRGGASSSADNDVGGGEFGLLHPLKTALDLTGGSKIKKNSSSSSLQPPSSLERRRDLFRPGSTRREKVLASALLIWNGVALLDALLFTFFPERNLNGYLLGEWGPHALAMTRMLANCQLGLVTTVCLVALCGDERMIKNMFKILILCTLGAFRAVAAGVAEGTVKAPWKEGKTFLMAFPPLAILSYFAFVF